jgi:uncharacterized protein DUF6745
VLSEQAVLMYWAAQGRGGVQLSDADRQDVVARIMGDYRAGGLPQPKQVIWARSPSDFARRRIDHRLLVVRHEGRRPEPATPRARWTWLPGRRRPEAPANQLIEEVGPGPQADPVSGWIATRKLLLICAPPRVVITEPLGTSGRHRLHNESGPAVEWDEGTDPGYYLHGVAIPAGLFRNPSVEAIHRESNSEVRRQVIERMGWLRYIQEADLGLVAVAPDPGNPGHDLKLYDLPKGRYGQARLLVMVNGSPDRSGRERQYVELVPDWIDDPVRAAAWQYDCPVDVYRRLARRT